MRIARTRGRRTLRIATAVAFGVIALAGLPRGGAAQTPYTALGLGYPVPPVDARAAALGGVGVGLLDGTFTIRNPADLVSFDQASLGVSLAPEGVTVDGGGRETSAGRSRLSVIRAVVPLGEWTAAVGFGSVLDQDWAVRRIDTLTVASGRYVSEELRENDGGLSSVDFSVARRIGPLSLGVSGERLTGSLRQSIDRRFSFVLETGGDPLASYRQQSIWSYSGWRMTLGAGLELSDRLRVSGSYRWSGELEADRQEEDAVQRFDMPVELSLGASARPGGPWLLTAGGGWSSWSDAATDLVRNVASDALWGGAGIEFRGFEPGDLPLRLRLGGRAAELPFHLSGAEQAVERALTLGVGSSFARGRTELDMALEIGSRGSVESTRTAESFTRFTVTATVHQ